MFPSSLILIIIFISCFNFILNLPSQKDIKFNISISTTKGISSDLNFNVGSKDNINISSFFILGFDNYIYDINNK